MDPDYLKTNGIRLAVALMTGILLILSDGMGWIDPVYSAGNYIVAPIAYWSNRTVVGVENAVGTVLQIGTLRSENAELVVENSKLRAELGRFRETERENDILRSQLGIELTKDWKLKRSRILGLDTYGIAEHVIIDTGSDDGVSVGDVVILGDLLIGEIREAYASTSKVRLVSNQNSNIFVIDQNTRAKGLVRGSLEGVVMEDVLENEQLNVGDVIITWEDDIPGGLVVGTVSEVVEVPTSSTKKAFLETGFSLEDIDYVFVVLEF
jgi:rod shape-determining protein MreC